MKTLFNLFFFSFLFSILFANNIMAQEWREVSKVVASDRGASDLFGYAVSISDNYAIVGALTEDEDMNSQNTIDNAGSAYLFKYSSNSYEEVQKITPFDREIDDKFGSAVGISGSNAIIGTPGDDSNMGCAYIYKNTDGVWGKSTRAAWGGIQKLIPSDRVIGNRFGDAVAISGDYAVVGAYSDDSDTGSAYVFKNIDGTWTQMQKLVASDSAEDNYFAYSVAISGEYIIIGASQESEDAAGNNTLTYAGAAYIFKNSNDTWIQIKKILPSRRSELTFFGFSVSLSGDYAIIGTQYSQYAYIYKNNSDSWLEVQEIPAPTAVSTFSYSVAISGVYALIGAYSDESAGSAHLYKNNNGTWEHTQKIISSDRATDDNFGRAVAISGNSAIAGASWEDEDTNGDNTLEYAGSAYLFSTNMTFNPALIYYLLN